MKEFAPSFDVEQAVVKQNQEIEIFVQNTPDRLVEMVVEEATELKEAVALAYLNDDLTEVASEVGDVFYLMIRFCNDLGIDWRKAVEMKLCRNEQKYGGQTDRDEARKRWKEQGGDLRFSNQYLEEV